MRLRVDELTPEMVLVVEKNMGLAVSIASTVFKTTAHALEFEEVRAQAYLGLVKAAARWPSYCAERGFNPEDMQYFATFSARRIRGEIIDSIRKKDFATRSTRDKMKVLVEAGLDQGATIPELAATTGFSEDEVRKVLAAAQRRPVSLEAAGEVPDGASSVESGHSTTAVLEKMVRYIRTLPVMSQVVLSLHYFRGMELREIAAELGITESRASQLHTTAVLGVRDLLADFLGDR